MRLYIWKRKFVDTNQFIAILRRIQLADIKNKGGKNAL